MTSPTQTAAARYASLGIAVFPLQPRQKAPYGRTTGLHMASADVALASARWAGLTTLPLKPDATNRHPVAASPAANIGIATGAPAGFWVLDIDGPNGAAWLAMVEAQHSPLPATVEQLTARGRHLCFALVPGVEMRNRSKVGGSDVDVRGEGGYICAAPSVHPGDEKKGVPAGWIYRWREGRAPGEIPFAQAPAWLIEVCRPVEVEAATPVAPRVRIEGRASAYGEAALSRTVAEIAAAQVGSRDSTLYRNACSIACLVAGGEIDHAYARADLIRAGGAHVPSAMSQAQLERQVDRALEFGASRPRSAPERDAGYGARRRPEGSNGPRPAMAGPVVGVDAPSEVSDLWMSSQLADVGMVRTWLKLRRLSHDGDFAFEALRNLRVHPAAPWDRHGTRGPALVAMLSQPGDDGQVPSGRDALAILPIAGGALDLGAERFVHFIGDPAGKAVMLTRKCQGSALIAIDLQDAWALASAAWESGDRMGVAVAPTLAAFCGGAVGDAYGRINPTTPQADPERPPWTMKGLDLVYLAVRGDLRLPEMRERKAMGGTRRLNLTGEPAARFVGSIAEQAWRRPVVAGGPGANRVRLLWASANTGFHEGRKA